MDGKEVLATITAFLSHGGSMLASFWNSGILRSLKKSAAATISKVSFGDWPTK